MKAKAIKYVEVVFLACLFGLMLVTGFVVTEMIFGGNPARSEAKPAIEHQPSAEFPEMVMQRWHRKHLQNYIDKDPKWGEIFNNPMGRVKKVIMMAVHHGEDGKVTFVTGFIAQESSTHKAKLLAKQSCYDAAEKQGVPVVCYVVWANGRWVGD